jgi:hypothetical protein
MDDKHINEDQFGTALALLGQTEKRERLKQLYDDLAVSDGMSIDGFFTALNRLRQKNAQDEHMDKIQEAFDALYEGSCLDDNQKVAFVIFMCIFFTYATYLADLHSSWRE